MCFHPLGRKGLDTRLRGYDGFVQVLRPLVRHSREACPRMIKAGERESMRCFYLSSWVSARA